jgi:hypothetical protein
MRTASNAVKKLNVIEKNIQKAGKDFEGKMQKLLAKNGPADRVAKEVDGIVTEAMHDLGSLTEKWNKRIQELTDTLKTA